MITVSSLFDAKMSQNTRPKLYAEVEFRQLTPGAAEDAEFAATGQNNISRLEQLTNNITMMPDYITLELNRWILDGTKRVMPVTVADQGQIGAHSESLANNDLTLTTHLLIIVTFSEVISSVGITLFFDSEQGGYAPKFTIRAYNGETLTETVNATATDKYCAVEEPLDNYNRLEIDIGSWSISGQRARVSQVRFGIVRIFSDDEIVEFSVLRQIDPVNEINPSSELRFAFDNRDGKYDFENPSGIYDYITTRQEAIPRIGILNEPVPLGIYLMSDWPSEDGKAAYQALDALSLTDVVFNDATYTDQTLLTIATAAFEQSGIKNYSLDSRLSEITVTVTIEGRTCREVLRWIATAACLTLYVDINGITTIGALPIAEENYTISYANSPKPKPTLDQPLKSITITYGTDLIVTASYESAGREINISDNPFIQTEARANTVLSWLAEYYQRRKNYQNDWRQNPKIEPGDIVGIQSKYGTPKAQILSQQYTYSQGGLSGQTKAKGV